jgi:hypothetical protein
MFQEIARKRICPPSEIHSSRQILLVFGLLEEVLHLVRRHSILRVQPFRREFLNRSMDPL